MLESKYHSPQQVCFTLLTLCSTTAKADSKHLRPCSGVAGAVILPVAGLGVGVAQVIRGAANTPEAIKESRQGRYWDQVCILLQSTGNSCREKCCVQAVRAVSAPPLSASVCCTIAEEAVLSVCAPEPHCPEACMPAHDSSVSTSLMQSQITSSASVQQLHAIQRQSCKRKH